MAVHRTLLILAAACPLAVAFAPSGTMRSSMHQEKVLPASIPTRAQEHVEAQDQGQEAGASWRPFAFGAALGLMVAAGTFSAPAAMAADVKNGEKVFNNICAACHAGGNNLVVSEKKLNKEALSKYGVDVTKVKAIVAGGQNAMPALGQLLSPEEIDDVANYVISQSEKGWS
mmetsp:Transcript_16387/g.36936  ORF Transcript_16387/g.36936 Transcript_16387/m.36936 type:complete len:172 (-) Transcript_16387:89-604(-)